MGNDELKIHDRVTYVPNHAKGNLGHKDCSRGIVVDIDKHVWVKIDGHNWPQSFFPQNIVKDN